MMCIYDFNCSGIVTTHENKTMTHLKSQNNLLTRYHKVVEEVINHCNFAGRDPNDVHVLAVSKKHTSEDIETVYHAGQRCFGENYVQEGVDKITALSHLPIEWHFIGPLQSNKTRQVAEHFAWLHTLDREKIAQRLSEQRPAHLPPLNVLIQVNISQQDSKSGIQLADVMSLAAAITNFHGIQLRGLMCIPEPKTPELLAQEFDAMKQAFIELKNIYPAVDTLSMGMSGDAQLAIEHGSTMVRIGTAIFGERH